MSWKTILVPTDFSDAADKAYAQALMLAEDGADVHLLHRLLALVPLFSTDAEPAGGFAEIGSLLDTYISQQREDARRKLDELAANAPEHVSVTLTVEESGETDRVILDEAERIGADLIALGTHGRRGLDRLLMGSVATKVLHHARRNVLLVRADSDLRNTRERSKILVPVDFSDYSHRALALARSLASRHGGSVHLVHVVEIVRTPLKPGALSSPFETQPELRGQYEEALRDMLGETAGDITVTDGISVAGATLKHCETVEADVVVMGTRGHTGLKHVLLGSVAETIARYSEVPVIVVK